VGRRPPDTTWSGGAMAKKAEEFRHGGGEIYVHKPAAE
jgi:hypothetical protein